MALKLPHRNSTSLARHGGGGGGRLAHYKERAKTAFSKARGAAHHAGAATKRHAGEFYRRETEQIPSLGNMASRQISPGIAAVTMGTFDNTDFGKSFADAAPFGMRPSTVFALAGLALRGFNLDRRYLGKHAAAANVAQLTAFAPRVLYELGARVPGVVTKHVFGPAAAKNPKVSGLAGAAGAIDKPEPIPGEATVA